MATEDGIRNQSGDCWQQLAGEAHAVVAKSLFQVLGAHPQPLSTEIFFLSPFSCAACLGGCLIAGIVLLNV